MYSASFVRAWKYTMVFEIGNKPNGGYSNYPDDPGGETKWGVSKVFNPDLDVKNLSEEGAMAIAYARYWKPMMLDQLIFPQIGTEMFDTAYNGGVHTAVHIVQGSLILLGMDIVRDGVMGPNTVRAINTYRYPESLLQAMNGFQFMMYVLGMKNLDDIVSMIKERKAHVQKNLRGWMKRLKVE
jgi:lysozyme family protein